MVRPNPKVCDCSKSNGCKKDSGCQVENVRIQTKPKQSFGGSTKSTINSLAKDMERIKGEIIENYNKMITTLDNNSAIIKSIKEDLEDIKRNYL